MACSPSLGRKNIRRVGRCKGEPMSLDRYRTAIVTGASRGIGAATVRQLCIGGLDVYALAPLAHDLSELARATRCRPLALDISHPHAVLSALGGLAAAILITHAPASVRLAASSAAR